jgi:type II secretory pathway pseudopilin PulG
MKRTSGISLFEVLIGVAMALIIASAASAAFAAAMRWQESVPEARRSSGQLAQVEQRLRRILQGAYLDPDQTDATTYFILQNSSGASDSADEVIFTSAGAAPDGGYLTAEPDAAFEDLNRQFGPQCGLAEIRLGLSPIGDGAAAEGLFLREQKPPDGDPTQGGWESLALEGVEQISFEGFNGADWVGTWDTRTAERRIPAAIRVRYILAGDGIERSFVARLPQSDVTPDNPAAGAQEEEA